MPLSGPFAAGALLGLSAFWMAAPAAAHPGLHEQAQIVEAELAKAPEDPERHISMGRILGEKKDWDAALASYALAEKLGAPHARIAVLQGAAYLDAGWPHMARERFEQALAAEPGDPVAHLGRARAWMKLEHPEKAVADFEVVLRTIPSLQPGYVLEYRDALRAAGRADEAIGVLDVGMKRLGVVPSLQLAAIDAQVDAQRYDDALRRLDLLLDTSPGHPLWTARRGEILERAGRTEEARLAYVDALETIQLRTASRRARRLDELEDEVRAAIARNTDTQEARP